MLSYFKLQELKLCFFFLAYRCPQGWLYACNSKQETGLIPSTYLVLNHKKLNARNPSFQQPPPPPQGAIVLGPNQHFDNSRNPVGNFSSQPNSAQNFGSQPNPAWNFSSPPNPAGNFSYQPSNLDFSRNPVRNPNIRPGDCLVNPGDGFNAFPDTNSNAGPSNLDYSRNPVQNPNIPPADHSANPGGKLPGYLGNLTGYRDTRDNLKNTVETLNSQPDCSKNSADNVDPRDCPHNVGNRENVPQGGVFGYTKNSTEEIKTPLDDKVPEEVAKNQNVNTTEN